MIKGHYIATVVIDINQPEDVPGLLPFEQMQGNWETLDKALEKIIKDELEHNEAMTVSVSKRYSHLYKSEDKA